MVPLKAECCIGWVSGVLKISPSFREWWSAVHGDDDGDCLVVGELCIVGCFRAGKMFGL